MQYVFVSLVLAQPLPVAPAPRPVSPEAQRLRAAVAEAETELDRQQRLRAAGAGSDDRCDLAELRVIRVTTELALGTNDRRGEHAARKAEVEVLVRRHTRAVAASAKGAEFDETVDVRLRELSEGRARLARFDGDRAALVKAHTTLVELAERRLDRAKHLESRKLYQSDEVKRIELVLSVEKERLVAAKTVRLIPRLAD